MKTILLILLFAPVIASAESKPIDYSAPYYRELGKFNKKFSNTTKIRERKIGRYTYQLQVDRFAEGKHSTERIEIWRSPSRYLRRSNNFNFLGR